jgi:hypothetical protein
MASIDMSVIELSKENVQPLRRGRNPEALRTALAAAPGAEDGGGKPGAAADALAEQKRCVIRAGRLGWSTLSALRCQTRPQHATVDDASIRGSVTHARAHSHSDHPGAERADNPNAASSPQGGCTSAREGVWVRWLVQGVGGYTRSYRTISNGMTCRPRALASAYLRSTAVA